MAAIMNGIALHGGYIPCGGTFLTFSDYSRSAIRMAALMKQRVIPVLTHDSIGLGEDGPTHQPVAHMASLRLIPNNWLWRPCDGVETAIAWQAALQRADGPTCLVLSRQALTPFSHAAEQLSALSPDIATACRVRRCRRPSTCFAGGAWPMHLAPECARFIPNQLINKELFSATLGCHVGTLINGNFS